MNKLATIHGGAVTDRRPAPPSAAFDKFTVSARDLIEDHARIRKALEQAQTGIRTSPEMRFIEGSGVRFGLAGRVQSVRSLCSQWNDDDLGDDGTMARSSIATRLARLIGAFPTSNVSNPDVFAAMLLEEVAAAETWPCALESACRQILRTQKFMPAVKEVLDALRAAETFWSKVGDALYSIEGDFARLVAQLDEMQKVRVRDSSHSASDLHKQTRPTP